MWLAIQMLVTIPSQLVTRRMRCRKCATTRLRPELHPLQIFKGQSGLKQRDKWRVPRKTALGRRTGHRQRLKKEESLREREGGGDGRLSKLELRLRMRHTS